MSKSKPLSKAELKAKAEAAISKSTRLVAQPTDANIHTSAWKRFGVDAKK